MLGHEPLQAVAIALLVVTAGCGGLGSTESEPTPEGPASLWTAVDTPTAAVPSTSSPTAVPTRTTAGRPETAEPTPDEPSDQVGFPVPPGSVESFSPGPDPPLSPSTRIQAFDSPLSPPNATEWYRQSLDDWTPRLDVESNTGEWGWMNQLAFTRGNETLVVYVTRPAEGTDALSEITVARGTGVVGVGSAAYYPDLGWGTVNYTRSPLPLDAVDGVVGLGNLNPPGHAFPTDHAYLGIPDERRPAPVVAPAGGVVTSIWNRTWADTGVGDYAVTIQHTNAHITQFQHLSSVDPDLIDRVGGLGAGENPVSVRVVAGDRLGTAAMEHSTSLDWFVYDYTRRLDGFAHPERYGRSAHAYPFTDYLTPDLRTAYEGKLTRTAAPIGGKIDYDRAGRLVGNWVLDREPLLFDEGAYQLAFVYSVHDPDQLRVSIGGTVIEGGGRFAVAGNGPDPATVTVGTGPVVYRLQRATGDGEVRREIVATVLVEVLDDHRIRVEGFDGDVDGPSFTEAARSYVR